MKKTKPIVDEIGNFLVGFGFVYVCWFIAISTGVANYSSFVLGVDIDRNIFIKYHELKAVIVYQSILVSLIYNITLALLKVGGLALETGIVRLIKKYRKHEQPQAESEAQ